MKLGSARDLYHFIEGIRLIRHFAVQISTENGGSFTFYFLRSLRSFVAILVLLFLTSIFADFCFISRLG